MGELKKIFNYQIGVQSRLLLGKGLENGLRKESQAWEGTAVLEGRINKEVWRWEGLGFGLMQVGDL